MCSNLFLDWLSYELCLFSLTTLQINKIFLHILNVDAFTPNVSLPLFLFLTKEAISIKLEAFGGPPEQNENNSMHYFRLFCGQERYRMLIEIRENLDESKVK